MRRIIYILLLGVVAMACNRAADTTELRRADSLMEDDPELALEILEAVDTASLSREEAARRAVLITQARVKCNIIDDSDSLISAAVDFYALRPNDLDRLRAYFYKAKLAYYHGDYPAAMRHALEAYESAHTLRLPLWIARSAEVMMDLNYEVYNFKQAEIYSLETIENYRKAGRERNVKYALSDLATMYSNQSRVDEAYCILDSLYQASINESPVDSAFLYYINMPLVQTLIDAKRLDKIHEYGLVVDTVAKRTEAQFDHYALNIYLNQIEGNYDEAEAMLPTASNVANSKSEEVEIVHAAYRQAKAIKDYKTATDIIDKLLVLHSQVVEEILNESLMSVQRDFYSSKALLNEQKREAQRNIFLISILFIIVVMISSWLLLNQRNRRRKEELESAMLSLLELEKYAEQIMNEKECLTHELEVNELKSNTLKDELKLKNDVEIKNAQVIKSLFKDRWNTINMLCNEYFELGDSEKTKTVLLKKVEGELGKLRSKSSLREIEKAVDSYQEGIVSLLRQECYFLDEDEIVFIMLIYAGFSVRAVCLMTNIKYKYYYLKKSRLIKRILSSDAKHKQKFIEDLG